LVGSVTNEPIPTRSDLRLLARVHYRDGAGDDCECFASILELGPRGGRIESAHPLEPGWSLKLQVVFPGQRGYATRHVHLNYVVRGPHDEPNLHYDLDSTEADAEALERLALYLRRAPIREI
jgi:hypothetical protein